MSIKTWPHQDRPREKLLQNGANALTDSELLAILLGTGTKKQPVMVLARELIHRHGTLGNLLSQTKKTLLATPGIGPAKYAILEAAHEIGLRKRYAELENKLYIQNSAQTKDYLVSRLSGELDEVVACLFLTSKYQLIHFDIISHGSIDHADINARHLIRTALSYNAAAVILAHNHPSGDPTPSKADINITNKLRKCLSFINIELVDHIVVAKTKAVSLADLGV